MGAATVLTSVCAFAPGKVAVIKIVGGVIWGYCAIGNCKTAANPASTIKIDSTDAKIGRVMKNLVIRELIVSHGMTKHQDKGQLIDLTNLSS